jgi:hypothetical protein
MGTASEDMLKVLVRRHRRQMMRLLPVRGCPRGAARAVAAWLAVAPTVPSGF